jgi:drug/metabolite transporter (DMT)-like permease
MGRQVHLISAAGLLLGAHFGSWVVCIENTSLSHALLAASCSPTLIAIGTWLLRKPISKGGVGTRELHRRESENTALTLV